VLLSPMADGTLLVVKSEETGREIVQHVRRLLLGAGAKVLGVILNQVDRRSLRYYDSYHYSNYSSKGAAIPVAEQQYAAPYTAVAAQRARTGQFAQAPLKAAVPAQTGPS
jgi:Mrp family chromosome partitioning ATPase